LGGVESASPRHEAAGLAHVATGSFLASRAAPSIGFWVALAGGVALARAAQRDGARMGYGASLAATLQTVALIGPARFSVPLTQALSAPLIGALEARATPVPWQMLACAAIRLTHVTLTFAFSLFVLAGGLDVYTESYEHVTGWTGFLPQGTAAAVALTAVSIIAWTVFASVVQVVVYRRGLARWPQGELAEGARDPEQLEPPAGRFDPRAVALAAGLAFTLLVAGLSWALLGAVAAWLGLAALVGGGDRSVVRTGVGLGLLLGGGVLAFTLLGGVGTDEALRRGVRALLFVLVATWLRAAAGASGLREVSRRALGRLGRVPPAREAAAVMDELGSGRQLGAAARSVLDALRSVPVRPVPVVDAVLGWVVAESRRFRRAAPAPPMALRARALDAALVAVLLACGLAVLI
jgi:hypothetical protein